MDPHLQLATYRQRTALEIRQVWSGFLHAAALGLLLWGALAWVLLLALG